MSIYLFIYLFIVFSFVLVHLFFFSFSSLLFKVSFHYFSAIFITCFENYRESFFPIRFIILLCIVCFLLLLRCLYRLSPRACLRVYLSPLSLTLFSLLRFSLLSFTFIAYLFLPLSLFFFHVSITFPLFSYHFLVSKSYCSSIHSI